MRFQQFLATIFFIQLAGNLLAEGTVENIAKDWSTTELRRVRVVSAIASSTLGEANGAYSPARAIDSNRGSKWVGSIAPTTAAPQWIELRLAGDATISSVAVFGEAVNNDGIVDAQVQVRPVVRPSHSMEFLPVAIIKDAKSASWRASFPPVNASTVRLLVTRSGGPTSHTDVYEVEVYGPKLSESQLEEYIKNAVSQISQRLRQATEKTQIWQTNTWFNGVSKNIEELHKETSGMAERQRNWKELTPNDRQELAAGVDRLTERSDQLLGRVEKMAGNLPGFLKISHERAADVQKARDEASKARAGEKVVAIQSGNDTRLLNDQVLVRLDDKQASLDVTWLGPTEAAIRGARFSVEIDGQSLRPAQAKIETGPFSDKLGTGQQINQSWGDAIKIEHRVRVYDGKAVVTVSGRITNPEAKEISLGTTHLLEVLPEEQGWWHLGPAIEAPGAVFIGGTSELLCQPFSGDDSSSKDEQTYNSTGILTLARREPTGALALGFLTAFEARPDISAKCRVFTGGTALSAHQRFLGRKVGPGESVELDVVYLAAGPDPYAVLEQYGDAAALFAQQPVRLKPTALWCSWYAHRMAMTEELVLSNAAVAAKYFQPLGLEIMQLDHGWQRGDITGHWVPNERFSHGLKWLADELKSRHGLRLGIWIAPTDVAETSETFQQHRDWLLKDEKGNPRVNWRWYWKPNPNCYELDASNPNAADWMENVFAQLTAWGVSYYKIDFIASAGGEHFYQHDPKSTRGWTPLRRAMESLRRGAGPDAWIRYCQTPPLLSAGLASSTIGGGDTLDAGLNGKIDVLRDNARHLAAGYWLNDRLYHREVCDMSVRMQAGIEEARLRLAMMTLAGCSISFSDELQYLPASRIRMMQQCLPPGNPPMKPLDLFERAIPSIWHIHCRQADDEWEIVGLFNFENQREERTVSLAALGLPTDAETAVFEFWEEKFLGVHRGNLTLTLPPQSSRILSIRRVAGHPQLVGTDMHLLQGVHEIRRLQWNSATKSLSGVYHRMPGTGKAFFHLPEGWFPRFEFPLSPASARLTHVDGPIWMQEFQFTGDDFAWTISFEAPKPLPAKEPTGPGTNL